jgi:TIR domain
MGKLTHEPPRRTREDVTYFLCPQRIADVPNELRHLHIHKPQGNVAFEVANAVTEMIGSAAPGMPSLPKMTGLPQISLPTLTSVRRIFISHSSQNRRQAQELATVLRAQGNDIVWDGSETAPGALYETVVQQAFTRADTFVFLVSPDSLRPGSRALGELALAKQRWPNPSGYVLPVAVDRTPLASIPRYLRAVDIVSPSGNLGLEVIAALRSMVRPRGTIPLALIFPIAAIVIAVATLDNMQQRYDPNQVAFGMVQTGVLLGFMIGAGLLVTGTYSVRQGIVAAFTSATAGALAAAILRFDVSAGAPIGAWWQIALICGLVFGFFVQLGLAITVPVLRRGPQWLLVPVGSAVAWMLTIGDIETGASWTIWLVLLGTWIGIALTGWPRWRAWRPT